ncbi:MAG: hypothetical protein LBJ17_01870 [Dysgonamonadaceae bacterium]|jgi:hypothetical protein|nr:hypothetical protein [Dysgonamonadaceae bacterium]
MKRHDFIPKKDSELVAWAINFCAQIIANAIRWLIPQPEVDELMENCDRFCKLHDRADSPAKNAIIVAEKNAARKTLVTNIRALANFRLKNPIITDAERIAMGLHVHDATPSSIPVPTTRPVILLKVLDVRRISAHFSDIDSSSKARPYGIIGAVVAYSVLDTPPADPNALTRTVLATRTPHTLEFTEEERGKTLYTAICWENEKGQKGPWSEIESAIIP